MKQLERLLFLQGGRCFFCREPIPKGEASVEHLLASSNGGSREDANCVVCCKTLNAALGNLTVKAKLEAILNQNSKFRCPRPGSSPQVSTKPSDEKPATDDQPQASNSSEDSEAAESSSGIQRSLMESRIEVVLERLKRQSSSRPQRLSTLTNAIRTYFQKSLSPAEIECLLVRLQSLGYITLDRTKVRYSLPADN
ncbi:MAG: hypothetical protein JNL58_08225 [Planctomyces sp.]|nr:hypothetical protein [Planctomyces sp.]